MPRLIVKRKREWTNWTRTVGIYVDGSKVGFVRNGQAEAFELPAGEHTLKAKMDWCRSNDFVFSVAENETKYVRLSAYKYADILIGFEILLLLAHIIIRRITGITYVIWFAVPFFLATLYYITIGYNKYLVIREDELDFSF